ncbi:MAG: N-acetylmuramoyl-L-alanine amidase, partial [Thermoanaerobaculia bacterium]
MTRFFATGRVRFLLPSSLLLFVTVAMGLGATPLQADPAERAAPRRIELSEDFSVLLADGAITVEVRQLEGETSAEFAKRMARDEGTTRSIMNLPLSPGRTTVLPYGLISDEAKRAAIRALFPSDLRDTGGWLHIAVGDETLWSIADWFTGTPSLGSSIAQQNGFTSSSVSRGTVVRIPAEILLPPFRDAESINDETPIQLEFGRDARGRYAIYRLRKKEALYSAVVVRFTGRLHAEDVVQLALKIALRSGIDDVHGIPVGFPIKIPFDYLSAEFLPKEEPRAQELVKEKAETAQFAAPAKAKGLEGIRVVIDAGHGGRDTGTLHEGIWESTYVYDVACRLRKLLSETTRAEVVMMTKEQPGGWLAPDTDLLSNRKSRFIMTTPPYLLADPVIGVNLRWYLANSVLKRIGPDKKKILP